MGEEQGHNDKHEHGDRREGPPSVEPTPSKERGEQPVEARDVRGMELAHVERVRHEE